MKMFQGFGKVDLPKLKWRSERHDGNARAMGGVLAVQWVAVKRQSLPLLASGLWLLLAGCCWPCQNGEKNCFQRSAMKSINLDQSREHVPWGSHFPCKHFLVMGGGHCCIKLAYLSFFCFCFLAFHLLFWTDGAQYVGELKPQTTTSTNCELTPREVEHSSWSKYESHFKSWWLLVA